jgi:hypothetical protein
MFEGIAIYNVLREHPAGDREGDGHGRLGRLDHRHGRRHGADRPGVLPDDPQLLGRRRRQPPRHAETAAFLEPFDAAMAEVYAARAAPGAT